MKKVLFLTLTLFLFTFGTVNLKGQVTIGSNSSPHPDAVLELKSNSRGLLLPQVVLKGVTDFLVNGGDKATAKGMLVYNTGYALDGPGLYVWTGSAWQSCKPGECPPPGKPTSIAFSPTQATNIPVKTLITVTAGLTPGASTFEWSVPEEFEIVGNANTRSIRIKAKQTGHFAASKITVKAVNFCGESDTIRGNDTIRIISPITAPATPTLVLPTAGTILTPGSHFTITCGDVGADEYFWTLPTGMTPVSGQTVDTVTTTNEITVIVAEGIYSPKTINVQAQNSVGQSGTAIGSGGWITVQACASAPRDSFIAPFTSQTFLQNATFTVSLAIGSEGATSYRWQLPEGLSAVGSDSAIIVTVRCEKTGNYNGRDIKVEVTNACGPATVVSASGTFSVVSTKGVKGTVTGSNDVVYTTYKYPNGLGTWMTQNSKEGSPAVMSYPQKTPGERGYYYKNTEAEQGCPNGWVLPAPAQFGALWSYLSAKTSIDEQNEPWLNPETLAGYSSGSGGNYWDSYAFFITSVQGNRDYRVQFPSSFSTNTSVNATTYGKSVRCIKSDCDESPQSLGLSWLPSLVPAGALDTVRIAYRSFGADTMVTWQMSGNGASIYLSTDTMVVLQFGSIDGEYDWSDLSCTVTNNCGSTTVHGSGTFRLTSDLGSPGNDLTFGSNTYPTWQFPLGLGLWMLSPIQDDSYPFNPATHGYYERAGSFMSWGEAKSACPAGWSMPSWPAAVQVTSFRSLVASLPDVYFRNTAPLAVFGGTPPTVYAGSTHGWLIHTKHSPRFPLSARITRSPYGDNGDGFYYCSVFCVKD